MERQGTRGTQKPSWRGVSCAEVDGRMGDSCCNGVFGGDTTGKQCVGGRCLRGNQEVEPSSPIQILIERMDIV